MTDKRYDLGQQGHRRADDGVALEHTLAGGSANRDGVALTAHEGQIGDPGDVDQPLRPGEPHAHERHEALAARDDSRVAASREHRAGLLEVRRPCIFERSGFHRTAFCLGNR
jgi:hypothetical protein